MNTSVRKYLAVERGSNSAKQFDIENKVKTFEMLARIERKLDLILNNMPKLEGRADTPDPERVADFKPAAEVPGDGADEQKELLVEEAHKLKLGAPSILRRWGIQKLEDEIAKASAALEDEEGK